MRQGGDRHRSCSHDLSVGLWMTDVRTGQCVRIDSLTFVITLYDKSERDSITTSFRLVSDVGWAYTVASEFLRDWSPAFAGAHFASALLFKTSAADPISICVAIWGLVMIATMATVLPAGRAATIDPMDAIRAE